MHDIVPTDKLLHGEEQRVFGDAGHLGTQKRDENKHCENLSGSLPKGPGTQRKLDGVKLKAEKIKPGFGAKVGHSFEYIKQVFDYGKVLYRGPCQEQQTAAFAGRVQQPVDWWKIYAGVGLVRLLSAKMAVNRQET